jgi:hypothetical protein
LAGQSRWLLPYCQPITSASTTPPKRGSTSQPLTWGDNYPTIPYDLSTPSHRGFHAASE